MSTSPAGTYLLNGVITPDPGGTHSAAGATAPTTDAAGTFSSPYALNQVSFQWDQRTPTVPLVFTNLTAVENFYGTNSQQATQAKAFFGPNGIYNNSGAQFITVRVGLGQRCHLIGGNLYSDTLKQLQAIDGTVSLTFDGFTYGGTINLSSLTTNGFNGVHETANLLEKTLNANRQTAAVTTGDTIIPETATFYGYTEGAQLIVTSVVSGTIGIGGYITGKGLTPGTSSQIIADRGPAVPPATGEQYSLFAADGNVGSAAHPELITETYGKLTIGNVSSGTPALGLELTDKANDLLPKTVIDYNLSGTGAGSTWVVNNAQNWSAAQASLKAPLLTVSVNGNGVPIYTPSGQNDFLSVTSNSSEGFDQNPSSMSFLTGTAADALLLSQGTAVADASPGGQHPTLAQFTDSVVAELAALGTGFGKLSSTEPRLDNSFSLWLAHHPQYQFISGATPPAGSSTATTDPAGTWSAADASAPTIDQPGYYSLAGASAPTAAQPGYYVPVAGASSETLDDPGYYTPYYGMDHEIFAQLPTIMGTGPQSDPTGAPDTPFAQVVVNDPNVGTTDTLEIAISGLGGTLADGAGFTGLTQDQSGNYLLTGTSSAITNELEAVIYAPNIGAGLTTFTLTDKSTAGTMVTNDADTVNLGSSHLVSRHPLLTSSQNGSVGHGPGSSG